MSWQKVKLGEVCHFVRGPFGGALKKDSFVDDGYAVYEQQHAIYNQFEDIRYFIDEEKFNELKRFKLNAGDLIMSCSGTMGKIAIVPENIKVGIINQALLKLTPSSKIDINFLKYWLKSESFQFVLNGNTHGAAIKNVASVSILKEIEIPLPPLDEQKRIAAILDKADAIRRKRQQAIDLADDFLRSVFLDMFGDPIANNKKWDIKTLGELAPNKGDMVDGPFGSSVNTKVDYIDDGEIPVIRTKNVSLAGEFLTDDLKFMTRDKYLTIKRSNVVPGDIVLTKVGTIGNVCIFPETYKEAVLSTTGSCRIRIDESIINKIYLFYFLKYYRPKMHEIASAGVQPFLNMKHIKSFEVPMPEKSLQDQFELMVDKISSSKELFIKASREQLFNALSQKAFSGKL
ncbi:putative Type I site-specific deoxyribonuclease [Alteromonas macleodii]